MYKYPFLQSVQEKIQENVQFGKHNTKFLNVYSFTTERSIHEEL